MSYVLYDNIINKYAYYYHYYYYVIIATSSWLSHNNVAQ